MKWKIEIVLENERIAKDLYESIDDRYSAAITQMYMYEINRHNVTTNYPAPPESEIQENSDND